jgi:hypothetical protein
MQKPELNSSTVRQMNVLANLGNGTSYCQVGFILSDATAGAPMKIGQHVRLGC